MTQRVRPNVKAQIDQAIAQGTQPKAPRNGLGLVLPSEAQFQTLYNKSGLTPAGRYYYDKSGIAAPGQFDFQQDAVRKGKSQYIKTLDDQLKKSVLGYRWKGNGS